MLRWYPLLLIADVVGCAVPVDETAHTNAGPTAALRAPVIAPLGVDVSFDASASVDPDGDPLSYVFQFNDGNEAVHTGDAVVYHSFAREAVYTALVRVVDLHNADSLAAQDVSVRREYPEVPDFCAEGRPCVVGDECKNGVCYSNGGNLD